MKTIDVKSSRYFNVAAEINHTDSEVSGQLRIWKYKKMPETTL